MLSVLSLKSSFIEIYAMPSQPSLQLTTVVMPRLPENMFYFWIQAKKTRKQSATVKCPLKSQHSINYWNKGGKNCSISKEAGWPHALRFHHASLLMEGNCFFCCCSWWILKDISVPERSILPFVSCIRGTEARSRRDNQSRSVIPLPVEISEES